jgi:UDP-N-acetylglucosamine 1-carboxyvinyltransferase
VSQLQQDKPQDHLRVTGNKRIEGEVNVSVFKHSAIPIMAASLLTNGIVTLYDIPRLKDTTSITKIMRQSYGSRIRHTENSMIIDNSNLDRNDVFDYEIASIVHGTVYLIPSALMRFGRAKLYEPGGCKIGNAPGGKRPIEHMIDVMKRFGAELNGNEILLEKPEPTEIDVSNYQGFRTSGATKTGIICGSATEGTTRLKNCYMAQEVIDLIKFMKASGVDISYNEKCVTIKGREDLKDANFRVSKDLIEIITFISAAATTRGNVRINADLDYVRLGLDSEFKYLSEMGFEFSPESGSFSVKVPERIKPINAIFDHPGAYTDNQPLFAAMLLHADGESTIEDRIWYSRFCYKEGFQKLGASISQEGNKVTIIPPKRFVPNMTLEAPDLRAASAYLVSALSVDGETRITNYHHLERGYQDLVEKLNSLGSDITEVLA